MKISFCILKFSLSLIGQLKISGRVAMITRRITVLRVMAKPNEREYSRASAGRHSSPTPPRTQPFQQQTPRLKLNRVRTLQTWMRQFISSEFEFFSAVAKGQGTGLMRTCPSAEDGGDQRQRLRSTQDSNAFGQNSPIHVCFFRNLII